MADGPINTEKVDWVVPVARNVDLSRVPSSNLAKAQEQHAVFVDTTNGLEHADIDQIVVTGLPAPKENRQPPKT